MLSPAYGTFRPPHAAVPPDPQQACSPADGHGSASLYALPVFEDDRYTRLPLPSRRSQKKTYSAPIAIIRVHSPPAPDLEQACRQEPPKPPSRLARLARLGRLTLGLPVRWLYLALAACTLLSAALYLTRAPPTQKGSDP